MKSLQWFFGLIPVFVVVASCLCSLRASSFWTHPRWGKAVSGFVFPLALILSFISISETRNHRACLIRISSASLAVCDFGGWSLLTQLPHHLIDYVGISRYFASAPCFYFKININCPKGYSWVWNRGVLITVRTRWGLCVGFPLSGKRSIRFPTAVFTAK